ncbi:MAG: Ig-like domain-containing protein, partial [Candidatus Thermoplasmatota archaeon]|nr:Ig-like domain-containing protein [Candidatus Thermoplasmatota archaeon]
IEEDTPDSNWLVLSDAFDDPDGDTLVWRVDPQPHFIMVEIDPVTGRVTLTPLENWHGSETITFIAFDGEFEANQTVTVDVAPINDVPNWVSVNGDPYNGETIELAVLQDEVLIINVVAFDVEGDDLLFRVSDNQVILDLTTGQMTFTPDNDDIGWLNFSLTVNDNVDPTKKIQANFSIIITNVNDPMDDPRIISPSDNDGYRWNESVGLRGVCIDPDEQHGQELNFSWSSNRSGHLDYGPSINYRFKDSGLHQITLTVSDGDFEKTKLINISVGNEPIPPPPPKPKDDEGIPMWMILLAVLVVVGAVVALMVVMRRKQPEPEPVPALTEEEQKRKDLEGFRDAVAATATAMEAERDAERAEKTEAIEVSGTGMVPSEQASHKMRLSEKASDETAKLWADMDTSESVVDEAEKETLRQENTKRKVQSAIEALPYGIPAPALRHISPDQLAQEIAEGSTHDLPDGTMLVAVRGKWYHGDPEDSSKFLTPYEKKTKAPASESKSGWEEG